jgi:branched-chain amino acid transport system permease protein
MIGTIMAGSLLGGFNNIYGAIIGGFTVGLSEILLTRYLQDAVGIWAGEYRNMIPMIILVAVMLIEPKGLPEIYRKITASLSDKIKLRGK